MTRLFVEQHMALPVSAKMLFLGYFAMNLLILWRLHEGSDCNNLLEFVGILKYIQNKSACNNFKNLVFKIFCHI